MKRNINIIFITFSILAILILSACEDAVQVELPEEYADLISVEAYLTDSFSDNIYVHISKTLPVDQAEANPPVNNAVVEISDDSSEPQKVTLVEYGFSGIYRLPDNSAYPTVAGRTYTLKISTPDGTVITGSDQLKAVEKLDKVLVNLSSRGNYEFLAIFINTRETPGQGNYYKWDIYINDRLLYESSNLLISSDELFDGNYIYNFEIFTDYALEEEDKVMNIGDTVRVEQLSISKAAYDFYIGMINQSFSGSPFSVPPANVPGNLVSSDGKRVLGIFSARDISVGNEVIIGDDNYKPLN